MRRSTIGTMLYLLNGPILWAAQLTTIYAAQAMMCARDLPQPIPAIVFVTTIAALVLLVAIMARPVQVSRLLRASKPNNEVHCCHIGISRMLSLLAAVAMVWAGATALWIPACPPLR